MLPRSLMLAIKKRIAPLSAHGERKFGARTAMSGRSRLEADFARTRLSALLLTRYLNPPRWSASILTGLGLILFNGCADPGPRALMRGERLLREGSCSAAIHELEKAA